MTIEELLATLPACIQIDEQIGWLTLNKYDKGFQAGYLYGNARYERRLTFTGPTPQEVLERLSNRIIELTIERIN